jgi:hypothetical protein
MSLCPDLLFIVSIVVDAERREGGGEEMPLKSRSQLACSVKKAAKHWTTSCNNRFGSTTLFVIRFANVGRS